VSARIELVYAGALLRDQQIVHVYYEVKDHRTLVDPERAHVYAAPLGQNVRVGEIWSFATTGHGAGIRNEGASFVRVFADQELLTEWRARHDAISFSEVAWSAGKLGPTFEVLAPIRAAYHRLNEEQQGILIAQVVRYICEHS